MSLLTKSASKVASVVSEFENKSEAERKDIHHRPPLLTRQGSQSVRHLEDKRLPKKASRRWQYMLYYIYFSNFAYIHFVISYASRIYSRCITKQIDESADSDFMKVKSTTE